MMSCEECQARLDDWLDDVLAPIEKAQVSSHLGTCELCRACFAQADQLQISLSALGAAAERMVAGDQQKPTRRGMTALTRIAAILVFGTVAVLIARFAWSPRPVPTVETVSHSTAVQPEFEIETHPTTVVCAVDEARSMAVHYKSKNPKVQIVWFYQPSGAKPQEPGLEPTSGPANETKGTRA